MHTLSNAAQAVIEAYFHLPFPGRSISAPYYNNTRAARRGGLRVLVGKGSPADIAEEAMLMSLRDKVPLASLTDEQVRKFLVDNRLGVDCSGFVYYVIDAECKARNIGAFKKYIKRPYLKNPLRKLLISFRPVENTGVRVLANDSNSFAIAPSDAKPGDLVTMLDIAPRTFNHVMIITDVTGGDGSPITLHYAHSTYMRTDGVYNHGMRRGTITLSRPEAPLIEQLWVEDGKSGKDNLTLEERAKLAKKLEIRRLFAFK